MKKLCKQLLPLVFLLLLIFFPRISIAGAREGLLLWYSSVIPALLPFLMISNLILKTGAANYFTYLFLPIYKLFPKLLKCLSYLLVIGFFCGYPMGAKIINDLLTTGQLNRKQARFLLNICNNASPMFIIGYVVVATLDSQISIPLFFIFLYLPVLVYAILRILLCPSLLSDTGNTPFRQPEGKDASLDTSMIQAFFIVLKIGGYIMLFSILAQVLMHITIRPAPLKSWLIGLSEVTTGIRYLSQTALPLAQKTAMIGAATAFGGFSSVAQTKSVLTQSGLSVIPYIGTKLAFGAMTYGIILCYYSG